MNKGIILALALAAIAAAGCTDRDAQKQAARTKELVSDPTILVSTEPARTADMADTREITGSIVTTDDASIGAKISGRLAAVYVADGQSVSAGQAIAVLDTQELAARERQSAAQVDSARSRLNQAITDAKVGPQKSAAAVRAAQARLDQAKARLARLLKGGRDEEVRQAKAEVARAKSAMETAKSARDRAQNLYKEGAVSKAELEQAENAYAAALAGYESSLETLAISQSAGRPEDVAASEQDVRAAEEQLRIERANAQLDDNFSQRVAAARADLAAAEQAHRVSSIALADATIRAPFSGRVSGRPLQPGSLVSPGVVVARIVGAQGVYFEAEVTESDVARISPGAPVRVKMDALPNRSFMGSVLAVNPMASGVGRLYTVRVELGGATSEVKPGMFARGELQFGIKRGVTVVPTDAILRDGENTHVFIVEGGKAKQVAVRLGLTNGRTVEVDGLSPTAIVVVKGQSNLAEGSAVKVETGTKPEAAQG